MTPPEQKLMAEAYMDEKLWSLLIKVHNMRISQLGEQLMNVDTRTAEGRIEDHGLKEKIRENEHFLNLFKQEYQKRQKALKKQQKNRAEKERFNKPNKLQDL